MRLVNNNIETLPIDMVVIIMELLLVGGFEDCFNFFLAWARTQRPPVIRSLLEGFPLRTLFKFGGAGGTADKACFDRFFRIGETLGVADAILYRRCRGILCAAGDIESHFAVIDGLARNGHFMSMVANFVVRNLSKVEPRSETLQALVNINQHADYEHGMVAALSYLENIYSSAGRPEVKTVALGGIACPIHSSKKAMLLQNEGAVGVDCFFCITGLMLTVFPSTGSLM